MSPYLTPLAGAPGSPQLTTANKTNICFFRYVHTPAGYICRYRHPPPTVNSFFSSLSSIRTTLNLTRGCKERYKKLTDWYVHHLVWQSRLNVPKSLSRSFARPTRRLAGIKRVFPRPQHVWAPRNNLCYSVNLISKFVITAHALFWTNVF